MIYLDGSKTQRIFLDKLIELGVNASSARHVSESLIQTSLRGVDSHGIQLFPHYCSVVESGRINRDPIFSFAVGGPSVGTLDADSGFGHHSGWVGMTHAIDMAKDTGLGAVAVKNSSHFRAAAYFGLEAANRGCLGLAFTNADSLIKAHGARVAMTGTNPVCFCAPMLSEEPFCLDMATSVVSWNKIVQHRRLGVDIPSDWACDENGEAVVRPESARTLLPAGGYKGFGLSLMVDILCGVLAQGPISKELLPMYQQLDVQRRVSHFFVAIDISRFVALNNFVSRLQEIASITRSLPTLDGEIVQVPGDPEKRSFEQRSASGIPVDQAKFIELLQVAPELQSANMPQRQGTGS